MENDALKPELTFKSVNCTTCYYNCIVGQTYIDSVTVSFYPLCCVTDVDCYRPSVYRQHNLKLKHMWGAVAQWIERATDNRVVRQTDRQTDRHIYSTKCTSKQVVQVNNCAR